MPIRPHFQRTLRDGAGAAKPGATVSLFIPGTDDPPVQTVYSDATGIGERGTTWVSGDGVIDFYLDDPDVVDIHVLFPGDVAPKVFANQWVGDAENVTGEGGGVKSTAIDEVLPMTAAEYAALSPKAARVLYVIRDEA